jgi:hypothetical protein
MRWTGAAVVRLLSDVLGLRLTLLAPHGQLGRYALSFRRRVQRMIDSAITSARWIVDTLLKRRIETTGVKRQKWIQVADYLETISNQIDTCISKLDQGIIPYAAHAQLRNIRNDFPAVLDQVYNESGNTDRIREYCCYLDRALTSILWQDYRIDRDNNILVKDEDRRMFSDLERISGEFRGAASTLKAMA